MECGWFVLVDVAFFSGLPAHHVPPGVQRARKCAHGPFVVDHPCASPGHREQVRGERNAQTQPHVHREVAVGDLERPGSLVEHTVVRAQQVLHLGVAQPTAAHTQASYVCGRFEGFCTCFRNFARLQKILLLMGQKILLFIGHQKILLFMPP